MQESGVAARIGRSTARVSGATAADRPEFPSRRSIAVRDVPGRSDRQSVGQVFEFPGGRFETCEFSASDGDDGICTTSQENYLVEMSLFRRPVGWTCTSDRLGGELELGRMFLIPPGETIRIAMPLGHVQVVRCLLASSLIDPFLGIGPVWEQSALREALLINGGQIEWLMWRMHREVRKSEIGSIQIVEGLAKLLAVEIIRRFNAPRAAGGRYTGGLAPWRRRLIEKRLGEDGPLPNLRELAELCNMSVRHLSRTYRVETGQTLGKHIEAIMARRARTMLMEGVPVGRIARLLGYSRTGNFSHAFHQATGLLPSDVKGSHRGCSVLTAGGEVSVPNTAKGQEHARS